MEPQKEWPKVTVSTASQNTHNPIRALVDFLKFPKDCPKPTISLSIGDPTTFGNILPPPNVEKALIANLSSHKYNGYAPSNGYVDARLAIAEKHTYDSKLTEDDVIITSGASGALDLAISVLCEPGDNILIPAPGFSLYHTLCSNKGIETRYYSLLPEKDWEADLNSMECLIDCKKTKAILVNNPSNPCGSVYSKEHLEDILDIAYRYQIPIIADEIYEDLSFTKTFYAMASLGKKVPVLAIGGLAKAFIVPGWRLGWVIVHDVDGAFTEVRSGLVRLSQLILGANSLIQSIVRPALFETPQQYFTNLKHTLQGNAKILCDGLEKIPSLTVVHPEGAMYMMVGIKTECFKDIASDVEFASLLLTEENVVVLPAKIFLFPKYVRLVITPPKDKLEEAVLRIQEFCARHHV